MKLLKELKHAFVMVRRNMRGYCLLSVTIVLSFTLLLGYMVYTDSGNYNKYKEHFAQNRSLVFAVHPTDEYIDRLLLEKASEIPNTTYQLNYRIGGFNLKIPNISLETGEEVYSFGSPYIFSIPARVPAVYTWSNDNDRFEALEITWLDGKEHLDINLNDDEIIVDEQLYRAVSEWNHNKLHCVMTSNLDREYALDKNYTVVGTIPSEGTLTLNTGQGVAEGTAFVNAEYYTPTFLMSGTSVNPALFPKLDCWSYIVFVSDQPELVAQLVNSMNTGARAVGTYEAQDKANRVMKTENRTKALICGAMLIILGINLYSCFANALNERRFEIGVKRALGASAWSIVRQFLYESLCVMALNILISVALVADIFIVYKFIYERTPNQFGQYFKWTIYISPYSVAMFAVCTLTLTVVFSLIFAYSSTQVRIADQLKAE